MGVTGRPIQALPTCISGIPTPLAGAYAEPSKLLLSLAKHHFMLDHSMLVYERRIGQGSYGTVYLGTVDAVVMASRCRVDVLLGSMLVVHTYCH